MCRVIRAALDIRTLPWRVRYWWQDVRLRLARWLMEQVRAEMAAER
jgi:hypothetical protein